MSAREWSPGDVAMVRNEHDVWNVAICALSSVRGVFWRYGVADSGVPLDAAARPLVVIDPDDLADVERARDALWRGGKVEDWQAALRNLAAPPRPEEPQGLGAVVEDDEGADWHRTRDGRWIAEDGLRSRAAGWCHINAVRVLSEGVTP